MLDALRRGAQHLISKILLGLLAVGFGLWGISDVVNISTSQAVAEVGDTEIDANTFQRVYARQVQSITQQMNKAPEPELIEALGIPTQVLSSLMTEATLAEAAKRYGLGISDERLATVIAEDPALRPPGAASFDRRTFAALLRDNGLTEEQYVAERRLDEMREQLTSAAVGNLTPPRAYMEIDYRFRNEKRTLDLVILSPALLGGGPVPDDAQLAEWYDANKQDFLAPEYRTLSVIALVPDALADASAITEEEARKEYERNKADYTVPEQRRVLQNLFPSVEEAEKIAQEAAAGTANLPDATDLGLVSRDKIVDAAIAEAAFSLPLNQLSAPINARFGGALVKVTEIVPGTIKPFEDVADEVRLKIATEKAERAILEMRDEIEDARAGGATLPEIAERFKLTLLTVTTDREGLDQTGKAIEGFPETRAVIAAAFRGDEGMDAETDPIPADRGFVFYALDKIAAPYERPLEDVKEQALQTWVDEESDRLLAEKADQIVSAARKGEDLAALAKAAGATVKSVQDVTRSTALAEGEAIAAAAFEGPVGHITTVEGANGSHIVLKVRDGTVPPFFPEAADAKSAEDRSRTAIENSLFTLLVSTFQTSFGTRIDETLVQSITRTGGQ